MVQINKSKFSLGVGGPDLGIISDSVRSGSVEASKIGREQRTNTWWTLVIKNKDDETDMHTHGLVLML